MYISFAGLPRRQNPLRGVPKEAKPLIWVGTLNKNVFRGNLPGNPEEAKPTIYILPLTKIGSRTSARISVGSVKLDENRLRMEEEEEDGTLQISPYIRCTSVRTSV